MSWATNIKSDYCHVKEYFILYTTALLSSLQILQTGSKAQPDSSPMGTGNGFSVGNVTGL
jgi:hypothetical protein